ncbi:hypothetical protein DCAR_0209174 [Daucus carota subsp. sativus]|uniref:non-specific serine/threonine protein kinase n=1 Tax=Daucus carota subsp. sativus TaxID=79200 RepID=A0AAF0WKI9_DAUCS|nr:hypothetical protein DCAR_0209174 [Daucus carota subsp. sativus]
MVHGMFICRDHVSAKTCEDCVRAAIKEISANCPLKNDASIWFDKCFVHYSNTSTFSSLEKDPSFISTVEKDPYVCMSNQVHSSDQPSWFKEQLSAMLAILTYKATSDPSNRVYAEDVIETGLAKFNGIVQCKSDLPSKDCFNCVSAAANRVSYCLAGKNEGIILSPNCSTRYELNSSTQVNSTQSPAPTKGEWKERGSKITISASVSASLVLLALLGICLYYYYSKRKTEMSNTEFQLLGFDDSLVSENQVDILDFPVIDLDIIHKATQQFSEANKLGEGGFGPVYKGTLVDGKQIAVKRLSRSSGQGMKEFMAEVTLIAKLQHRNLVKLLGCSLKNNEMLLVYDYMSNKSLDLFLFDSTRATQLDWKKRFNIINGIARGIVYLHEDSRLKIIHRDLKASNILLDHEMNPKISDFGMARIFGSSQSEANTNRVVGTYGYMAPEYAMEGIFSVKSDVYSFGVLLLEMISGRKNNGFYLSGQGHSLLDYAWKLWSEDKELELIDPLLTKSLVVNEVLKCIHIGLLCVQDDPAERPTMSSVIVMLGSNPTTFTEPSQPLFFIGRIAPSAQAQSNEIGSSVNGVTISNFPPR